MAVGSDEGEPAVHPKVFGLRVGDADPEPLGLGGREARGEPPKGSGRPGQMCSQLRTADVADHDLAGGRKPIPRGEQVDGQGAMVAQDADIPQALPWVRPAGRILAPGGPAQVGVADVDQQVHGSIPGGSQADLAGLKGLDAGPGVQAQGALGVQPQVVPHTLCWPQCTSTCSPR